MKRVGAKSKKIKYKEGDVFLIPSSGGGFYVGQIGSDMKLEIGAIFCYLFNGRIYDEKDCGQAKMTTTDVISASLITSELIEYQQWKICCNRPVPPHPALEQMDELRQQGFVGARVVGAGNVSDYMDTYHGIMSASRWPDPNYVFSFFLKPPAVRTFH